jgi:hypothetical protein
VLLLKLTVRYPNSGSIRRWPNCGTKFISEGVDLALRMGLLDDNDLIARKLCTVRHQQVAAPACLLRVGTPFVPQTLPGTARFCPHVRSPVPLLAKYWRDISGTRLVSSRMHFRSNAVRTVMEALAKRDRD